MRVAAALRPLVVASSLLSLAACKPSGQKAMVGPVEAVRFDEKTAEGATAPCYVFGGESSRPARLCGEGGPISGYAGALFDAVPPPANSKFAEGGALAAGVYLLRPSGSNAVDAWPLGALTQRLWLGGGKALLAIERGRRVRLIDPVARAEREINLGPGKADGFLALRAEGDAAVLLVQKNGGEELVLIRDPLGAAQVGTLDVTSDDSQPGNARLAQRIAQARAQGQVFQPAMAQMDWAGTEPRFEGAQLGPFRPPAR